MKVLIYKRTHKGDPKKEGIFGNQDCMGRIRNWNYDAVIGIGGKTAWKEDLDIKYKINWIGLEPKKIKSNDGRKCDKVVFSHFELYEGKGVKIKDNYPNLFKYMYESGKRFDMSSDLPKDVYEEVKQILDSIKDCPKSEAYDAVENIATFETKKTFSSSKCGGCFGGKEIEMTIQEC
ncbi:MAG TPA: hypothetical protein PKK00_06215 [Bacteroidales bacterium]|nr:hypothetical protein [Bacteroidales bacterium]HPS16884.1 hypothetical protein [Bacteroidales bacterium]